MKIVLKKKNIYMYIYIKGLRVFARQYASDLKKGPKV